MAKKINPLFGQMLKALREAATLTQQGLADQSGVLLGTVRELEQGRREPLFGLMQRIAKVLKVSLDEFPPTTLDSDDAGEGAS